MVVECVRDGILNFFCMFSSFHWLVFLWCSFQLPVFGWCTTEATRNRDSNSGPSVFERLQRIDCIKAKVAGALYCVQPLRVTCLLRANVATIACKLFRHHFTKESQISLPFFWILYFFLLLFHCLYVSCLHSSPNEFAVFTKKKLSWGGLRNITRASEREA